VASFACESRERKTFASDPLDIRTGRRQVSDERSRGARTLPGGSDKEVVTVRVLVVVLLGLVLVLAILTELCLLQAASMRRKIRAVLPPEDQEDR
jgi:hypothetical protein